MVEASRIAKTLEWMITDMKYRHDETKGNLGEGGQSDYSQELKEAIEILRILREEGQTITITGIHHFINCREFKCQWNNEGQCVLEKISLQSEENPIVGHLICIGAEVEKE